MLRGTLSSLVSPSSESVHLLVTFSLPTFSQTRGRRRTLTPPPWVPPVFEKKNDMLDEENKALLNRLCESQRRSAVSAASGMTINNADSESSVDLQPSRRVGLLVRKIGMLPQWTNTGDRMLCTLLEVAENNVVSVSSPDEWYRKSIIGKRKAFNREGPLWKVTVGAIDGDPFNFTSAYRKQFIKAGVPVKHELGSFLVSEDAIPPVGCALDARHFDVGQYITASGKSIDWGFQGGMHRWGMRGQPTRRTTKSHRRIGSVGSTGDARIWPGKRMPGHMGYEWVTVSGLQIVRMNIDKQVIYVKGSVPGEVGDVLQLKDCLQPGKLAKNRPCPTWTPSLEIIDESSEEQSVEQSADLTGNQKFSPELFRFSSPSISFTDSDARKTAGRDKTKAKIAKVKK